VITVTQLRAFLAVARAGGVQSAAEQLHVSQPSVSAAVAALAREVGAELVERDGRGVRLTDAGRAFEPYAAQVLGLLEQGRQAAVETDAQRQARIRVAAVHTAGEYLLPPLIQAYRKFEPDAEILLEIGNNAAVLERLTTHGADVGIGGEPAIREVVGEPFLENELIVVGREEPDELSTATWLLREPGSGTRAATERLLTEKQLEPTILTLGSNGAIKRALAIGLGVTLVSRCAVARELRDGQLVQIPVKLKWSSRRWNVLRVRDVPERPAVAAFRAFLHSPEARAAINDYL